MAEGQKRLYYTKNQVRILQLLVTVRESDEISNYKIFHQYLHENREQGKGYPIVELMSFLVFFCKVLRLGDCLILSKVS